MPLAPPVTIAVRPFRFFIVFLPTFFACFVPQQ
jgi:hypothetical protein